MVTTNEIIINFEVQITEENYKLVRRLAETNVIQEDPDDIEIGDTIGIAYSLVGEFSDVAISIAMLFNSTLATKPTLKIVRDERK